MSQTCLEGPAGDATAFSFSGFHSDLQLFLRLLFWSEWTKKSLHTSYIRSLKGFQAHIMKEEVQMSHYVYHSSLQLGQNKPGNNR